MRKKWFVIISIVAILCLGATETGVFDKIIGTSMYKPDIGDSSRYAGTFRGLGIIMEIYENDGRLVIPVASTTPTDLTPNHRMVYDLSTHRLYVKESTGLYYHQFIAVP